MAINLEAPAEASQASRKRRRMTLSHLQQIPNLRVLDLAREIRVALHSAVHHHSELPQLAEFSVRAGHQGKVTPTAICPTRVPRDPPHLSDPCLTSRFLPTMPSAVVPPSPPSP